MSVLLRFKPRRRCGIRFSHLQITSRRHVGRFAEQITGCKIHIGTFRASGEHHEASNGNDAEEVETTTEETEVEEITPDNLAEDDYQLNEALNLLKGLAILSKR